jgi:hypothetical protein
MVRLAITIAGTFVTGAWLAGCAATSGNSPTFLADPGKYQFSGCESLAKERNTLAKKEEELRLLMNKAEQGSGGAVVSLLAYKADYVAATEELKIIANAARAKNCDNWQSNSAVQ